MRMLEFQSLFKETVITKRPEDLLSETIIPGGRLDIERALDIYRRGYIARLTEAIGETYECVWKLLGDDQFFDLCREYIRLHRSLSYNLSAYGLDFNEFLSGKTLTDKPFINDLALLDRYYKASFESEIPFSDTQLPAEDLQENVRFHFSSSIFIFEVDYNVSDFWVELRRNEEQKASYWPTLDKEYILMYKYETKVFVKKLTENFFYLLSTLMNMPLMDSFEHVQDNYDYDPAEIQSFFQFLIQNRLITGLKKEHPQNA